MNFVNDYSNGAMPCVLKALTDTNSEVCNTYGDDRYSAEAVRIIREACSLPDADIEFAIGGTQANMLVISSMLQPWQGVVCPTTGHINVHETGAIEATGHKVITVPSHDGLLDAAELDACLERCDSAHVDPVHETEAGLVFISFPSELGTIYSESQLADIARVCHAHNVPLYIDGARLSYGLAASGMTMTQFALYPDVFYIGGTKTGCLCGEAIVFKAGMMPRRFRATVKQRGALLAKSRLTGVQFAALMSGTHYHDGGANGVAMAARLRDVLTAHGFAMMHDSPTNQQFFLLTPADAELLRKADIEYSLWGTRADGTIEARFVTSWSTTEADIDRVAQALNQALN